MLAVVAGWADTGRMDGHRMDAQVILYSVQCCRLHWTDNNILTQCGKLFADLELSRHLKQNPRWRPAAILKKKENCHNSAAISAIFTKSGVLVAIDNSIRRRKQQKN